MHNVYDCSRRFVFVSVKCTNFLPLKLFIVALYKKRTSIALKFAEQQTVLILEYNLKLFKIKSSYLIKHIT
jgi:hypothetical protein